MELWISFAFGLVVGSLAGFLFGRHRATPRRGPQISVKPPPAQPLRVTPPPVAPHAPVPEGAANVLNMLNNRLTAISALTDLLRPGAPEAERARAIGLLNEEVRRAAEIVARFAAIDPASGSVETTPVAEVVKTVLADREVTLRELGVKLTCEIPADPPPVACPLAQLNEMLTRLVDFSLRRLRDSAVPRALRISVSEAGPSVTIAFADSGAPLSLAAEQRLVSPFRFTQGGGGEIEFALARALAQSSGGTLRLRPRGERAEAVVTLPKSTFGPNRSGAPAATGLPRLRVLVIDDDEMNRHALRRLLERQGHTVTVVENGVDAVRSLALPTEPFDVVITDLRMPRLGGRALWEQLAETQPALARRFVFVTGDGARDETRRFLEECGQPSVLKPYDVDALMTAIGRVAKPR